MGEKLEFTGESIKLKVQVIYIWGTMSTSQSGLSQADVSIII